MKTALVTTTIHTPSALALFRQHGADVKFFVVGDEKTSQAAYDFCDSIPNCVALRPTAQTGWKCSALIGPNCIQRRNIGTLEAIRDGADCVVFWDDDNLAVGFGGVGGPYFWHLQRLLNMITPDWRFYGLLAYSPTGWFDPGCLLVPQTKHRGFPIGIKSDPVFSHVVDAKIGVAAGLCLGDPDIDACTRIATAPIIHSVSELGRAGVVVDPSCKTVFNSQNTAFLRELAPAMFMMPGIGRYDDIYASLICQRVMRERGLHVHFGQPFVWQQRNQHDLVSDLRMEIDGMAKIETLASLLDLQFTGDSVLEQVRSIYAGIGPAFFPLQAKEAALAFLDDIEPLL